MKLEMGLMRFLHIRHWHSPALLLGGLLLAGCSKSEPSAAPPGTSTQAAATTSSAPSASAAAPPSPAAPKAARAHGRRVKLRQKAANLAEKDSPSCGLSNDKIYRLILTNKDDEDNPPCPVAATDEEKKALGDPWGAQILQQNAFPTSVDEIVSQMKAKIPGMTPTSFVLGEGSQVPASDTVPRESNRDLRYVVTWAPSGGSTQVFLSARPGGHSSFLQVIAWDAAKNWFNFYEYNDQTRVWSWTGNSTYASQPETRGHGCFDCHHNGIVIMKELTTPWNNWHSSQTHIVDSNVPAAVAAEALFQHKAEALALERVVERYQQAFHDNRIDKQIVNGQMNGVPDLLRHIISQSTINLVSSGRTSGGSEDITVPLDFFIRQRLASIVMGGDLRINNTISRAAYAASLTSHHYRLVQSDSTSGYTMNGSTYFSFLVPAYSAEDDHIATYLVSTTQLVDAKFEAAVMLVDFQNPIFSNKREGLLQYANQLPSGAWAKDAQVSDVPQRFAALVEQGARNQPACDPGLPTDPMRLDRCTAEQQFLHFWRLQGDDWKTDARTRISSYAAAVGQRIQTQAGVDDYMRLAVSRRAQMKNWPVIGNLVEFSLLFPQTDLPEATLRMYPDGTVSGN